MDLFDVLNLVGGLSLFLFGMSLMGQALERRAGSGLKALLGKLTGSRLAGLLTGIGVTAIIQSSSATTVMVVGFVNSGLMTLRQAVHVIMGANIGTTVTAWVLSLAGIESESLLVQLLKPSSFTPVLALIGISFYMMGKDDRKKDVGVILLGFATLMFGMEEMSSAVSVLQDEPSFRNILLLFTNPVLGVLAGAVLTAIIQSSSASVGILQALASTGAVTYGAAIPIIMGQNIGTCVTAILSSFGATRNAKRAALVHLCFNVIGTAVWLSVFSVVRAFVTIPLLSEAASLFGIAVAHSVFNVLCTLLMLPLSSFLERLVCRLIPDAPQKEAYAELEERLLSTPSLALAQCRRVLDKMANSAITALNASLAQVEHYDAASAESIRAAEDETDHLEDALGTYLVRLTSRKLSREAGTLATAYMKLIGDYERIADHAVNVLESAEEMKQKGIVLSDDAKREYAVISGAVKEILALSYQAFSKNDLDSARETEPLEQVIDDLKETLRTRHILRLQQQACGPEAGFVWSDLLTNLERVSDHCSNISGCVLDAAESNMNIHQNLRAMRSSGEDYQQDYRRYSAQYAV
ncbi:MAG: Na/Pi cotransporter family protein [Oscillospiraceae bacterium]|nr:Na/Pi cotransporter family protein [Oscillospiraceae bacterium]